MRLAVDVVGFTNAAEACCSGNQITAMLTQSLSGKLSGYAGMAGDDAMSADFAAEYDAAARESLGALVELTYAFSSLSRLLATSGDNHGRAEAAAAGRVYNADTSWPASHFVHYRPPPPPSSLGANNPDLGMVQTWVLDHVEGFIWPGADVHQLLAAAATWQSTASSIADLEHQCDEAITLLERQHSPEVPLATTALTDLRSLIGQTAQEMHAIASSCEEYAEAVRTTHERTLALINEICQMIVEGIAFSAVVGLLSSGIGAGAAGTAAMARIATQAPRFHALLVTLRMASTKAVTRLRTASDRMAEVRRRAGKYPRVRDERGSFRLPGGGRSSIKAQDKIGGHIEERHIGRNVDQLATRAREEELEFASSFKTYKDADRALDRVFEKHAEQVQDWLANGKKSLRINAVLPEVVGVSVDAAGNVRHVTGVRVILVRSNETESGYRVVTTFPQPTGVGNA